MSTPEQQVTTQGPRRSALRRVFTAPEIGLVLVIALLAAYIAVRGGTKPGRALSMMLPADAAVTIKAEGGHPVMVVTSKAPLPAEELGKHFKVSPTGSLELVSDGRISRFDVPTEPGFVAGSWAALSAPGKNTFKFKPSEIVVQEGAAGTAVTIRGIDADFLKDLADEFGEKADGNITVDAEGKKVVLDGGPGVEVAPPGMPILRIAGPPVNKFLATDNLVLLAKDASYIAVMAVGMTAVMVMGGIDLSVGSVYALAAAVGAILLRYPWGSGVPSGRLGGVTLPMTALTLAAAAAVAIGAFMRITSARAPAKRAATLARSGLLTATAGAIALAVLGAIFVVGARDAYHGVGEADTTFPLWASLLIGVGACVITGAACGLFSGCMIVGLRVHPFIITLGMMELLRGLVFLLGKGQTVSGFPESFTRRFFKADFGEQIYPVPVFFMIASVIVGSLVLTRTVLGRRAYAIGGNEIAAGYAGVPVGRTKIIFYTVVGAMAGLSAAMYLGYLGAAEPAAGSGYELNVIAACVIGGVSLSGGRGSVLGAMLGAILVQLITNAIVILEIDNNYFRVVMGSAIVLAVVLDQLKSRFGKKGKG